MNKHQIIAWIQNEISFDAPFEEYVQGYSLDYEEWHASFSSDSISNLGPGALCEIRKIFNVVDDITDLHWEEDCYFMFQTKLETEEEVKSRFVEAILKLKIKSG
jgi:hypothetical protein